MHVPLEQAGALCASTSHVFCACGRMIWKLDRKTLTPTGLFCGGPDMCQLMLSPNGMCLYALCGEADSILQLNAGTGEALFLNRVGVNPRQMSLDRDLIAVAGGESGLVLILRARSLCIIDVLEMPGPVYGVAMEEGRVYALCLTAALSSVLVTRNPDGSWCRLCFEGMPGCLLLRRDRLLAATDGLLHMVSLDGKRIIGIKHLTGRMVWMAEAGEETLMLDGYTEKLFAAGTNGMRLIAPNAAFCGV